MRTEFHQELEEVEASLVEECDLVVRSLQGALGALRSQDAELAEEVVAFDDEVDRRYVFVQESIERLLARQTPVAVDLRLVLAMLHVNLHLERAGDYCVTIAKLVKLAHALEADATLVEGLDAMGTRAEGMLRLAVSSFRDRDVAQAEELVSLDEEIDTANRRLVHEVLALGSDEQRREWGLRMILVSRCLERIGDHAVDIGEQTAYLVTGEFREFTDASHPDGATNGR
ncbi:MAG TPA: phosphate signaling complex protein PhoU [Gaiellaceae bacterium]|jgi:phosphate transport system protein